MTDENYETIKYIEEYIESRVQEIILSNKSRYAYHEKLSAIRSRVEQEILEKDRIFEKMNLEVLEKLLERKYNLRWEIISEFKFLTEDFIKKNYQSLSPKLILDNYPHLSKEIKEKLYSRFGVMNKLRYGIIGEEEIIADYESYGKSLRKEIKNYIKAHPEKFSEAIDLFFRLRGM